MNNFFLLLAGALSLSLFTGCSDDSSNPGEAAGSSMGGAGAGGAGVGGAGPGGAGQGGASAGGAPACDPTTYDTGKPCQQGDRCQDGKQVWHCTGGSFEQLTRIAEPPLPSSCQPLGTWSLVAGEPVEQSPFQGCGPDRASLPTQVRMVADADGGLLSSLGGQFDTNACELSLSESTPYKNPSENWSLNYTASITFTAEGASGEYTRHNSGFCNGSEKGTLTVTKK